MPVIKPYDGQNSYGSTPVNNRKTFEQKQQAILELKDISGQKESNINASPDKLKHKRRCQFLASILRFKQKFKIFQK